jgi:glyoxylate reductase
MVRDRQFSSVVGPHGSGRGRRVTAPRTREGSAGPARVVTRITTTAEDLRLLDGVCTVSTERADPDAVALVCGPVETVGRAEMDELPGLRLIAVAGAGIDGVDEEEARRRGISIVTCGPVLAEATADVAVGLLIAAARRFVAGDDLVRSGQWQGWEFWGDLGVDISGSVLGIVGYGAIGRSVATRAEALGMRVLHHTRHDTGLAGWVSDLDELLGESQHVSLHVPLTPETWHLIDGRRLALLSPAGVLVNTSRGPVVDEEALADALDTGALFAAGLDVYEHEPVVSERLRRSPRTVLLPHVGSATATVRQRMLRSALLAVRNWLTTGTEDPRPQR